MSLEIERKFLVNGIEYRDRAINSEKIRQGYLCREPERTVRVRTLGEKGFLTVKSKNDGIIRHEYEYEIPISDAEEMLKMCVPPILEKTRFYLKDGTLTWEIDEYAGTKAGLVVAEIELPSENYTFEKPSFIGVEVTGDSRYYNSNL